MCVDLGTVDIAGDMGHVSQFITSVCERAGVTDRALVTALVTLVGGTRGVQVKRALRGEPLPSFITNVALPNGSAKPALRAQLHFRALEEAVVAGMRGVAFVRVVR